MSYIQFNCIINIHKIQVLTLNQKIKNHYTNRVVVLKENRLMGDYFLKRWLN